MTGTFITVEGIDGAGKTTAVNSIQEYFDGAKIPKNLEAAPPLPEDSGMEKEDIEWKELEVITTSEPSDYWTGEAVYRAIGSESETPALADFFLFMADRINHIENRIEPALRDDKIVVSDRYADSTRAYQPNALKDHVPNIWQYKETVMEPWNLEPDLTIFLDISIDTAIERSAGEDKYENREFLEEVKSNYERVIEEHRDRFVVIDGERPKHKVKADLIDSIVDDI